MTNYCASDDGFYKIRQKTRQTTNIPKFIEILYDWPADLLRFILTLLCGGCNYLATKRISKTASINSISKHQRATRFVWYIIVIMAVQIIQTDAKPIQRHMIKHTADEIHRPRQISKRSHGSSNSPDDWNNPCGGTFDGSKPRPRMDKDGALHFLRKAVRSAFRTLKSNDKQSIKIDNFKTWDKHKHNYKFIPKLTNTSNTALKRWYRNVQTYVAGFSYLHNVQQSYDHKNQNGGGISNELKLLMDQARLVLCEIESTINRTSAGTNIKFSPVSQIEMDKRLKFATRIHSKNSKEAQIVYEVDLIYMKHHFLNFLNIMGQVLRKDPNKGNRSVSLDSSSSSVSSNEVNSSRSRSAGKKHRLAKVKITQNKKAKRGPIVKNNSLSASEA